jgi:hypothetical protein
MWQLAAPSLERVAQSVDPSWQGTLQHHVMWQLAAPSLERVAQSVDPSWQETFVPIINMFCCMNLIMIVIPHKAVVKKKLRKPE